MLPYCPEGLFWATDRPFSIAPASTDSYGRVGGQALYLTSKVVEPSPGLYPDFEASAVTE